ncbi:MAG: hypothetical protein HXY39_19700 [Chloroflexi bacterium]|nr:hypothetical protein [Chloroflexota bacterium]
MDTQFEQTLIACLDALDAGEALESILERHPRDAAQLRPILETAIALRTIRPPVAAAAQARSRRRFLTAAREMQLARRWHWLSTRLALGLAMVLLTLIGIGAGTVAASGDSLPGDALYGVKRAIENIQLATTAQDTALVQRFEARRRDEVNRLISARRTTEVTFDGTVEEVATNTWRIAGVRIFVTGETRVAGPAIPGAKARVTGRTGPAGVTASQILVDPASAPAPTSTATPVPTRTPTQPPTATVTPTATFTPQPTATPPPTPTITPRAIPSPRPTRVPATAAPVQTPEQPDENRDDNRNDNRDDNRNDNGDDDRNDNRDDNGDDDRSSGSEREEEP